MPALGYLLGSAFAAWSAVVSLPLVVALGAAGVALGGEGGLAIAGAAAGAVVTEVRWRGPERRSLTPVADLAVEAEITSTGHPVRGELGWVVPVKVLSLRQAGTVGSFAPEAQLALPSAAEPPPLGTRCAVAGYLRRSPGFADVPPVDAGVWRLTVKVPGLVRSVTPPGVVLAAVSSVRRRFDGATLELASREPAVALARALLVGDTANIPDAWRRALRRSGLLHLLAVSGFNVGLLLAAAWLGSAWWPPRVRQAVAGVVLLLYVGVVGPLASVLRAGAMGGLLLLALLARRPPIAANALAVAMVVVLGFEPSLLEDLGFGLTFAATAGLVFLAPRLAAAWSWMPPAIARPLAATWSAQLATLPWALGVFHQVHPGAFLTNLLFVPLAAVAMLGDLAWAAIACVSSDAGAALLWLPKALALPFAALTRPPAGPWFVMPLAARDAAAVALLGLAITWAVCRPRRALAALLIGVGLWCAPATRRDPPSPPRLEVFDVGQGDAALLVDGESSLLIDGGGWSRGDFGGTVLLAALAAFGVVRLDSMVMTHSDSDHCRGLVDLADYVAVKEAWMAAAQAGSPCARALAERVGRVRLVGAGDTGDVGRWRLDVLGPRRDAHPARDNDASLVLRAAASGRVFLFTGDIEAGAERELLARVGAARLHADVLKVAHHGSRTSSGEAFLAAVRPRVAVISVGQRNRFGHPDAAVLGRLVACGARVLRTDRDGQVSFALGGDGRWRIALPAVPRPGG